MKSAEEWMQIHAENAFYANGVLDVATIEAIQSDAKRAGMLEAALIVRKRASDLVSSLLSKPGAATTLTGAAKAIESAAQSIGGKNED